MITPLRFKHKISVFRYAFTLILLSLAGQISQAQPGLDFISGKALFEKNWVPSPSSTSASDGLGPLYNARSCNQCHPGGGRGSREQSLTVHINDPVYGRQLQKYSVAGLSKEAEVLYEINNSSIDSDLFKPQIKLAGLAYGQLTNKAVSARVAPALYGLGMLAQIPESFLLALADENDSNGDGISGRVNYSVSPQGVEAIGRFGWKASQPGLNVQLSKALSLDLGLGNPVFPAAEGDCTHFQAVCSTLPNGNSAHHDNLEVNALMLELLLSYVSALMPPDGVDFSVVNVSPGAQLFRQTGCAACHIPTIEMTNESIHPYSDMLLHDMGPGLADELVEGGGSGNEWRTPPLWGLGRMSGEYLHDGRASTLHEAVLWHDGEAATAKQNYLKLNEGAHSDLITFLNSL